MHVVEDEGEAPPLVVHVVRLGVLGDGHADLVARRARGRLAEAERVTLVLLLGRVVAVAGAGLAAAVVDGGLVAGVVGVSGSAIA